MKDWVVKHKIPLITALAVILVAALLLPQLTREQPVARINLPTAATTGTLYPLGAAMAAMWNERLPSVRVTAQASGGGVDNLRFLRAGDAQVTMAVTSVAYQSYHGEGVFSGEANPDVRVLAGLYYNPNQVVALKNSGITALADIAGKRFAPGAPGSTTVEETQKHLALAGVAYPDGFSAQYVGFNEAVDLMRNRQLDGAWIMAGVPTAAVTELISTASAQLVPMDDALIDAMRAQYPWYVRYTIPAGSYPGQEIDIATTAIKMVLVANASLSEELAYDLVQTFWENIGGLQSSFASLRGLTAQAATTDLAGIPLHPGAARYYAETEKQ